MGLPLTTRGTQILILCDISIYRITPAYAGNTCLTFSYPPKIWDHPRLRGEHYSFLALLVICPGSPPPTRGTLYKRVKSISCNRITPAYAGNTVKPVHTFRLSGSPPPTQGTLYKLTKIFAIIGITPAYAGNTDYKRRDKVQG